MTKLRIHLFRSDPQGGEAQTSVTGLEPELWCKSRVGQSAISLHSFYMFYNKTNVRKSTDGILVALVWPVFLVVALLASGGRVPTLKFESKVGGESW